MVIILIAIIPGVIPIAVIPRISIAVIPRISVVAPAIIPAGTVGVPVVPVAIRTPMTMAPVSDQLDIADLYLFGSRHENRSRL